MLRSNGSLGCCPPQAWHRDSGKGPCPLPPAWSCEESTGWHDENKVIITETPNVTMSWTRMIGKCCTMISLKRVHSCNGHFHFWTKKQCKKWFGPRVGLVLSRVHKLSYAKSFIFFFVPETAYVKNFPLSIVLLTIHAICEFVGLFEVFRPVIFIGTLCIFEYLRIRDWQPIS